jgi:hypothetical protein
MSTNINGQSSSSQEEVEDAFSRLSIDPEISLPQHGDNPRPLLTSLVRAVSNGVALFNFPRLGTVHLHFTICTIKYFTILGEIGNITQWLCSNGTNVIHNTILVLDAGFEQHFQQLPNK